MKGAKKSRSKKFVTRGFNRSLSNKSNTSLSQLLIYASYKKRINHLTKNNRLLACALQEARIETALQNNLIKDYAKDSNQIMFARLKLNEMAKSMAKFVTDLEEVRNYLNVELPSSSSLFTKNGLNDGIIKAPTVNCIEEVSISSESETLSSEVKNKQTPTVSDVEMNSLDEVSLKSCNERKSEVRRSSLEIETIVDEISKGPPILFVEDTEEKEKKSSSKSKHSKKLIDVDQLSLTPELDIGLTVKRKRTSSRRMSSCSFPEPRSTRSREKAASTSSEKRLSTNEPTTPAFPKLSPQDQILRKTGKSNEKLNESPYLEEVKLLEPETIKAIKPATDDDYVKSNNPISENLNQAERNIPTSFPCIMPADDNHTMIFSVDMELTEVIPPVHSIIVQNSMPITKPAITATAPSIDNNISNKEDAQTSKNIAQNNSPVSYPHSNFKVVTNSSKRKAKNQELNTELKSPKIADRTLNTSVSFKKPLIERDNLSPPKLSLKLEKVVFDDETQIVPLAVFCESEETNKNINDIKFSDIVRAKKPVNIVLSSSDESEDDSFSTVKENSRKKSAFSISSKKSRGSFSNKISSVVQKVSSKFEDSQLDHESTKPGSVINDSEETDKDNKNSLLTPNSRSSRSKKPVNYKFFFSPGGESDDDPSFVITKNPKSKDKHEISHKKSSEKVSLLNAPSATIKESFAEFANKASKDYSVYNLDVSNSEREGKAKAALKKLKISKQKANNCVPKPLSHKCSVTKVKAGNYKFSKIKSPKISKNALGLVLKQSSNSSPGGILKKRPSDCTYTSTGKEGMSNENDENSPDLTEKALPSKDVSAMHQSILDTPKSETKRVSFAPTDVVCNFKRMSVSRQIAESRKVRYTSKFALDFEQSPDEITPGRVTLNPDADISFGSASDTELYTLPLPFNKQFQDPEPNNVHCDITVAAIPDKAKDAVRVENKNKKSHVNESLGNSKKIGKLSLKRNKSIQKELPSHAPDKINEINTLELESPKSVSKDVSRRSLFETSSHDDLKENMDFVHQTLENATNPSSLIVLKEHMNSVHQPLKSLKNPASDNLKEKAISDLQAFESQSNPSLLGSKKKMSSVQTSEISSNPPKSPVEAKPNIDENQINPSSLHLKEKLSSVHETFESQPNPSLVDLKEKLSSVHETFESQPNPSLVDLKEKISSVPTSESSSNPSKSLVKAKPNPTKNQANPSSLEKKQSSVHETCESQSNPSLLDLKEKMSSLRTSENPSNLLKSPVKAEPNPAENQTNPSSFDLKKKTSSVHKTLESPPNPTQSPIKSKGYRAKSSEKKRSKKSSDENLKSNKSLKKSTSEKPKSVKKQKNKDIVIKSAENSPVLKDVVNIPEDTLLPRRRSHKPVTYKEPSLNKKLRRA